MKITHQWLKSFTEVAADPKQLAAELTLSGLEVESVNAVAPPFSGVVVGEVLSCERHPNAEKLSLCQVTTDGANRLQIICGAGNVRSGLKVAVAQVDAVLPDGHAHQARQAARPRVRGDAVFRARARLEREP